MNTVLLLALLCSSHAARISKHRPNGTAVVEVSEIFTSNSSLRPQPLVVNRARMPLVVYLERGFLFNKQVIRPGEAVQLYTPKWGPDYLPYSIIALVGDEASLPSDLDSLLNFVGMSAVPVAFVGGVVVSVVSWGALTGPAAALAPMVSNLPAIAGFTIGAVDIAAGVAAAGGADQIAEKLIKKHPKAFMNKVRHVLPGTKYFEVSGGPSLGGAASDLSIREISQGMYMSYNVGETKLCESLRSQGFVARASFTIEECGDERAIGRWRKVGEHSGRPRYNLVDGQGKATIEWSASRKVWRLIFDDTWFGHGRPTLYQSAVNSGTVPDSGWEAVEGGLPVPDIELVMASEDED